jgi:hypothetical protein
MKNEEIFCLAPYVGAEPIYNDNGITVKQLKEYLDNFPDDAEVWLSTPDGNYSNECKSACQLGRCDVILGSTK